jgi:glutamine synthetase
MLRHQLLRSSRLPLRTGKNVAYFSSKSTHQEEEHVEEVSAAQYVLGRINADVFDLKEALKELHQTNHWGKFDQPPPKELRDALAKKIFSWATEKGAINFAHWASPLRGTTNLLKHDSFVELDFGAKGAIKPIKAAFSGSRLFASETDGSSFPNGGLRATHRAAAYMAWDTSSPPFIRGDTLYLPSAFVTFNGEALDEKTPLLRSQKCVNSAGKRFLPLVGADKDECRAGIDCNVGWEQEFFFLELEDFERRPDLVAAGRTVLGAEPARGQQTSVNYFAAMHARGKEVMEDVQAELLALGVPFAVYHNEVAPAQHEFCPIFRLVNVAADHNILAMEILKARARDHGLVALTHEKPFRAINGSGKHLNWGLNAGHTGRNLFVSGDSPAHQQSFMAFVACLVRAVNHHGTLIRAAVASPGNDHRLGAHEAPPAIISLYLGDGMSKHIDAVISGGPLEGYGKDHKTLTFKTDSIYPIAAGTEDRNRTAPFPFCGNRFELRAMGSDGNISFPLTVVQAAMADSMNYMSDLIEQKKMSLRDAVATVFKENKRIIFNGNGYSEEWHKEAETRGIKNIRKSVDAYSVISSPEAKALFSRTSVLNESEVNARVQIAYESHAETIKIEANVMLDMLNKGVIPACAKDLKTYSGDSQSLIGSQRAEIYKTLVEKTSELDDAVLNCPDGDAAKVAKYCDEVIRTKMNEAREYADSAERLIEQSLYPFPTYHEMFFKPQQRVDKGHFHE